MLSIALPPLDSPSRISDRQYEVGAASDNASRPSPFVMRIGERTTNFSEPGATLRRVTLRTCLLQGHLLVYMAIRPSNCPLSESRSEFIWETTESIAANCFR